MPSPTFFAGTMVLTVLTACATSRPPLRVLERRLRHPNPEVRVRAMKMVPLYGPEVTQVLPALVEGFRDRRESVHRAAEDALVVLKQSGAQSLGTLLSDQDSWVRCRAASALGRMPADAASVLPALIEALRDRDFCVAEKSALTLGAVGEPAVHPLIEALKSNNASTRKGAAEALGYMPSDIQTKAGKEILPLFLNEDPFVRGEAAMRITNMGKIGIPIFIAALKETDEDIRQRAVDGLGEIGRATPEVIDELMALFKSPERTLRLKASVVLGRLGQRDSLVYKRVSPQLASKDKEVLLGALRALGDMGAMAEPSLSTLVSLLEESPDENLRSEAAEALVKMGTTASLAAAERYTRARYHSQ